MPPDGPETAGTSGRSVLVIGGFDGVSDGSSVHNLVPRRGLPHGRAMGLALTEECKEDLPSGIPDYKETKRH